MANFQTFVLVVHKRYNDICSNFAGPKLQGQFYYAPILTWSQTGV